jgi:hypothetical protein
MAARSEFRAKLAGYALAACCLALTGCGDSSNAVRGRVTIDGQPVESGSITFEPADGQGQATGAMIKVGSYELTGAQAPGPGAKTVVIQASRKTGRTVKAGPPFPPEHMIEEEEQLRYDGPSALQAQINPGNNECNFELAAAQGRKTAGR